MSDESFAVPVDALPVENDPTPPNPVAVCPACGRSVVIDGKSLRLAKAEDTQALPDAELKALKRQRADVTKPRG